MRYLTYNQIAILYLLLYNVTEDMNGTKNPWYKMGIIDGMLLMCNLPGYSDVVFDEDGCPTNVPWSIREEWLSIFHQRFGENQTPEDLDWIYNTITEFLNCRETIEPTEGHGILTIQNQLRKSLNLD